MATVRPATPADLPQLERLYRMLFGELHRYQPLFCADADQDPQFIQKMIQQDRSDILVAVDQQNRAVAMAVLCEMSTPPYQCNVPHRYGFLLDLVCHPQHRSQGIGSQLLDACSHWCRQRGLDYLELNVLPENLGAMRLYQRSGFVPAVVQMRRML